MPGSIDRGVDNNEFQSGISGDSGKSSYIVIEVARRSRARTVATQSSLSRATVLDVLSTVAFRKERRERPARNCGQIDLCGVLRGLRLLELRVEHP
jgi:hypothetical protein